MFGVKERKIQKKILSENIKILVIIDNGFAKYPIISILNKIIIDSYTTYLKLCDVANVKTNLGMEGKVFSLLGALSAFPK